jgi:hypothetical protein
MIEELRRKLAAGEAEYSLHAVRQMVVRMITPLEIVQAVLAGEVIEDYPEDKYSPSCLIAGRTATNRALHVQCTHPSRSLLKVITAYEPDPAQWDEGLRKRKIE